MLPRRRNCTGKLVFFDTRTYPRLKKVSMLANRYGDKTESRAGRALGTEYCQGCAMLLHCPVVASVLRVPHRAA